MQRRRVVARFKHWQREAERLGSLDAMLVKALDRAKTRNEASLKSTSWRGAPTCLNMERAVKCSSAAIATLREVMRSGDLRELEAASAAAKCALIAAAEVLRGPVGARVRGPGVRRIDVVARQMGDSVRIQNARNTALEAWRTHLMEEDPTGYAERLEGSRHNEVVKRLRDVGFVHEGENTQDWEATGRQLARLQANSELALYDGVKVALQKAWVLAPTVVTPSAAVPLDSGELLDISISHAAVLACAIDTIQALLHAGSLDADAELLDCPVPEATLEVERGGDVRKKDLLDALKRVVLAAEEVALPEEEEREELTSVPIVLLRRTADVLCLLAEKVSFDQECVDLPDLGSGGAAAPMARRAGTRKRGPPTSKYYGVKRQGGRWRADGYDPFCFGGDGRKDTYLGCYSSEREAALAVDGFLHAMHPESAGLYSNRTRFPDEFENLTETELSAERSGRMFGEIQADPTLGQDEQEQAADADANYVNNSFPEDPELMAFELEMTYGGYKPGEALGGFEDLDALDVTERTLKTSAVSWESLHEAEAEAAAAARAQRRKRAAQAAFCKAEQLSAAVQAATAQRAEVAVVRESCRGQRAFLLTVAPADQFAAAHVRRAGHDAVAVQIPAPYAPLPTFMSATDTLLSTCFINTIGMLVLLPSPSPTTVFYRFWMPPRPEAICVSKQFSFTPLDQDTERVVRAAGYDVVLRCQLRCESHMSLEFPYESVCNYIRECLSKVVGALALHPGREPTSIHYKFLPPPPVVVVPPPPQLTLSRPIAVGPPGPRGPGTAPFVVQPPPQLAAPPRPVAVQVPGPYGFVSVLSGAPPPPQFAAPPRPVAGGAPTGSSIAAAPSTAATSAGAGSGAAATAAGSAAAARGVGAGTTGAQTIIEANMKRRHARSPGLCKKTNVDDLTKLLEKTMPGRARRGDIASAGRARHGFRGGAPPTDSSSP